MILSILSLVSSAIALPSPIAVTPRSHVTLQFDPIALPYPPSVLPRPFLTEIRSPSSSVNLDHDIGSPSLSPSSSRGIQTEHLAGSPLATTRGNVEISPFARTEILPVGGTSPQFSALARSQSTGNIPEPLGIAHYTQPRQSIPLDRTSSRFSTTGLSNFDNPVTAPLTRSKSLPVEGSSPQFSGLARSKSSVDLPVVPESFRANQNPSTEKSGVDTGSSSRVTFSSLSTTKKVGIAMGILGASAAAGIGGGYAGDAVQKKIEKDQDRRNTQKDADEQAKTDDAAGTEDPEPALPMQQLPPITPSSSLI